MTRESKDRERFDRERFVRDGMRASLELATQERPTYYRAPGLRAAREAANMTIEQVGALSGYGPEIIRAMENGTAYHTVSISRVSSVIPGHDLSEIRDEG